jgi:virginiamycin B lyase
MSKHVFAFIGIFAAVLSTSVAAAAAPPHAASAQLISARPVIQRARLLLDQSPVRARANGTPYLGTVKTLPGIYGNISAIAYDPDLDQYFVIVHDACCTYSIDRVTRSGHATQLATFPSLISDLVYDPYTKLVYITYFENWSIYSMSPMTGAISFLAGGHFGTGNGQGQNAEFQGPTGITVDASGKKLYVGDETNVRIVTTSGNVTTLTQEGALSYCGPPEIEGVAFDQRDGDVYVAEPCSNLVLKVSRSNQQITVVAGKCVLVNSFCENFQRDGVGGQALFAEPMGIAYDEATDTFDVADCANGQIRVVQPNGTVTTLAGSGHAEFIDGVGEFAGFDGPCNVAIGADGLAVVADYANSAIRTVVTSGPPPPPPAHGIKFYNPPTIGAAPFGIAATADGSIWFSESSTTQIGRIFPSGKMHEYQLGSGNVATYIAADAAGNIWFAEGTFQGFAEPSTIGRLSETGSVTLYPLPNGMGNISNLVVGADGNIWFTAAADDAIGYVTPTGTFFFYPADPAYFVGAGYAPVLWTSGGPVDNAIGFVEEFDTSGVLIKKYSAYSLASGPIVRGPNSHMWFGQPSAIGEVLPGALALYLLPQSPANGGVWNPADIREGSDGNIWFTSSNTGYIARMTPNGTFTPFEVRTPRSAPQSMIVAPDGSLWFADPGASKIGRWF